MVTLKLALMLSSLFTSVILCEPALSSRALLGVCPSSRPSMKMVVHGLELMLSVPGPPVATLSGLSGLSGVTGLSGLSPVTGLSGLSPVTGLSGLSPVIGLLGFTGLAGP